MECEFEVQIYKQLSKGEQRRPDQARDEKTRGVDTFKNCFGGGTGRARHMNTVKIAIGRNFADKVTLEPGLLLKALTGKERPGEEEHFHRLTYMMCL